MSERTCACGARFVPRNGKHRRCRRCRIEDGAERTSLAVIALGVLPSRRCDWCGRVFTPRAPHQRFCSDGHRYAGRARPESERYGMTHQRERASAAVRVAAGGVRCARGADCRFAVDGQGGMIQPDQAWDLGHVDGGGPHDYSGPEHSVCNRGAPSRNRRTGQQS